MADGGKDFDDSCPREEVCVPTWEYCAGMAFEELDRYYDYCLENMVDCEEEIKRRLNEKIASLDSSSLFILFFYAAELYFRYRIKRIQAVNVLYRNSLQYFPEQIS